MLYISMHGYWEKPSFASTHLDLRHYQDVFLKLDRFLLKYQFVFVFFLDYSEYSVFMPLAYVHDVMLV